MAKFCANCGAQLDDGAKVCGQCGTAVVEVDTTQTATVAAETPKAASDNKIIKYIGLAIVAIVVIVILSNVIGKLTGYNSTINKLMTSLAKDDVDSLASVTSLLYADRFSDEDQLHEEIESRVTDKLNEWEDSVGEVKKIKAEVTDETEMSKRKLADVLKKQETDYHLDTSAIKKIVEVDVKLTVKGKKKSAVYYTHLNMVKEAGKWKVYKGNLD